MKTSTGFLIIGASAAGISACEAIRRCDLKTPITVISDENQGPYSRCLISYYLAGARRKEDLFFRDKDFFMHNQIKFLPGRKADRLKIDQRTVTLEGGDEVSYRALLLATGGIPNFPEIEGIYASGVVAMRTIADVERMITLSGEGGRAIVIGGGLIGCKAAYALRERGMDVTIVVGSNRVLSQMLDTPAAEIFRKKFEERGITILTGSSVGKIRTERGIVTGVELSDGDNIPCRMVVVGKGVSPRIELADETEIETEVGILVNEKMATNIGGIYAAGDVAQAPDIFGGKTVNSLWPVAAEQGRIAGYNMAGQPKLYPGAVGMNSIGFYGIDVIAAGKVSGLTKKQEAIVQDYPDRGIYKKLVIEADRAIGFILVGEIESAGVILSLIKQGVDISHLKEIILSRSFDFGRVGRAEKIKAWNEFPALKLISN